MVETRVVLKVIFVTVSIKLTVFACILLATINFGSQPRKRFCATDNMSSFYVTLPSNVHNEYVDEGNTISNYTTNLSRNFIFPSNEDWEVGLAEISYPKSWYNLTSTQNITLINTLFYDFNNTDNGTDNVIEQNTIIEPGMYPTPHDIVVYINGQLKKTFGKMLTRLPALSLNRYSQKISYKLGKNGDTLYYLSFSPELGKMLGFYNDQNPTSYEFAKNEVPNSYISEQMMASRPVDLYAGYHTLYVYSDVVEHSEVGNTNAQILRTIEVPTDREFGDQVVLTYQNPFYIPLLVREFQTIEIDIKNEVGESVPFQLGRVIIVLNFRRRYI